MGMRALRYVFGVCGAGLLWALAATAFAASDHAPASSAPAKAASAGHRNANAARPRHGVKPAPDRTAIHKEHKKEIAGRPTTASPAGPSDKSPDKRPLLGSFSFAVEMDQNVRPRSIRGGEYDPDRDGDTKGLQPPYLGFSLTAPLSW
jgi:hypothetical protein